MDIEGASDIGTAVGASATVVAPFDDDPTWQHSTVSVSAQAANSGSHAPLWIDGAPIAAGFSEYVTAWQPLSARRRTSLADSSMSKYGRIPHGMNRSGYA